MKSIFLLCFCTIMLGCAERDSVDHRNFAIDTYYPTPNEIQLAEQRARNYWAKHADAFWLKPGLSGCTDLKDFPERSSVALAETDQLRDDGQLFLPAARRLQ